MASTMSIALEPPIAAIKTFKGLASSVAKHEVKPPEFTSAFLKSWLIEHGPHFRSEIVEEKAKRLSGHSYHEHAKPASLNGNEQVEDHCWKQYYRTFNCGKECLVRGENGDESRQSTDVVKHHNERDIKHEEANGGPTGTVRGAGNALPGICVLNPRILAGLFQNSKPVIFQKRSAAEPVGDA